MELPNKINALADLLATTCAADANHRERAWRCCTCKAAALQAGGKHSPVFSVDAHQRGLSASRTSLKRCRREGRIRRRWRRPRGACRDLNRRRRDYAVLPVRKAACVSSSTNGLAPNTRPGRRANLPMPIHHVMLAIKKKGHPVHVACAAHKKS